jgi:hypothetical protein
MFDSPFRATIGTPTPTPSQQQQHQKNPFKRIFSPARPSLDEENQGNQQQQQLQQVSTTSLLSSSSTGRLYGNCNTNDPLIKRNKLSSSPVIVSRIRSTEGGSLSSLASSYPNKLLDVEGKPTYHDAVDHDTPSTQFNHTTLTSSTSILGGPNVDPAIVFESRNREDDIVEESSTSPHGRRNWNDGPAKGLSQRDTTITRTSAVGSRRSTLTILPKTPPKLPLQRGCRASIDRDGTDFKVDVPTKPSTSSSYSTATTTTSTSRSTGGKTASAAPFKKPGIGASPIPIRRTTTRFNTNSTSTAPEEVKATDEGYASVAKLSEWLASDPTSTKKKKHIRLGKNIVSKSRRFEKDANIVSMDSNNLSRGAVSDKKKWLQKAFRPEGDVVEDETTDSVIGSRYAKSEILLRSSTHNASSVATYYNHQARFGVGGPISATVSTFDSRSEIITNDAASSLSVSDKKDWLKNAFATKSTADSSKNATSKHTYGKAHTDIMHSRDEAATRAKMRFKERSGRKLLNGSGATSSTPVKAAAAATGRDEHGPSPVQEEFSTNPIFSVDEKDDKNQLYHTSTMDHSRSVVNEDTSNVDFCAAREALVQRSKQNGHQVQVINKVYLRKTKYEKMEEENRRKSQQQGLILKPSWDLPAVTNPSAADAANQPAGRPSNVYERSYVAQDIAAKKSFEDLP